MIVMASCKYESLLAGSQHTRLDRATAKMCFTAHLVWPQVESGRVDMVQDARAFWANMVHTVPHFLQQPRNVPAASKQYLQAAQARQQPRSAAESNSRD
jgi:hypothetical protein